MRRSIKFHLDGLTLAGHLFAPEGFDEIGRYPAVIVEGSFTSVKEQMPGTYAAKLERWLQAGPTTRRLSSIESPRQP
jgi:fermentation-respiration switch protein FrsA (DUF1100 family)